MSPLHGFVAGTLTRLAWLLALPILEAHLQSGTLTDGALAPRVPQCWSRKSGGSVTVNAETRAAS